MRFVTSMTASGVALGNVFCAPVIDSCLMDVSLVVAGLLVVPDPPGAAMGLSCAEENAGSHRDAEAQRPLSKIRTTSRLFFMKMPLCLYGSVAPPSSFVVRLEGAVDNMRESCRRRNMGLGFCTASAKERGSFRGFFCGLGVSPELSAKRL